METPETPKREVAVPQQRALSPVADSGTLQQLLSGEQNKIWTSLDVTTPQGKLVAFNASQSSDDELLDNVGQRIKVAHLMISNATKIDAETGEELPLVRLVLIEDDGSTYQTFSAGVLKSIRNLIGLYGVPPWLPPLEVEVQRLKLGNGHQLLQLKLIGQG